MPITKAIISTAGFGTRFLPISKTIQKEMLPILNRPMIDYVVEDCVKAGIQDIIIVMNSHNYQPLHYFRENKRLYRYLENMSKTGLYEKVKHLHEQANFHFVKQRDIEDYGTSIPVKLAAEHIKNEEAFLYLTGDDFIYHQDPQESICQQLIDLFYRSQADAVITCIEKPQEELHRYGVAKLKTQAGIDYLQEFVEKPKPGTAPSNLANVSKYVLTPNVLPMIEEQTPNPGNGEYYITDIVLQQAQQGRVVVKTAQGDYLNAGEPITWLEANVKLAAQDENIKPKLKAWLKQLT
jgi:UTP--glucose-1-phosphate uridylyltransferase